MDEQNKQNTKIIFLPNAEQSAQMIETAWQDFLKKGREAGYDIGEETAGGWLKDAFAGGYTYGWNDGYGIIRGQLEAMNLEQE